MFTHGQEPDPRFSLANERTFLAWIRTALALMAGGVALEALAGGMHPGLRLTAALVLVSTGLLVTVQAWSGWARTELALRRADPLPAPLMAVPLVVGCVAAGVLVLLAVILRA
ncbi:DUF202 domain-containing protein [Pseudonocardia sp. NPDC049635]|uniref:YidH family protein n=1 Tax=Pseudonocardia sp. NPDC049635 TaxID=3155506 RepID=UPI0033C2AEAA